MNENLAVMQRLGEIKVSVLRQNESWSSIEIYQVDKELLIKATEIDLLYPECYANSPYLLSAGGYDARTVTSLACSCNANLCARRRVC